MPRLSLIVQPMISKYPTLPLPPDSADLVFTSAGAEYADGASFPLTGNEILVVHNVNASAQTITIESAPDPYRREGDITAYSLGPGEYAVFPPFPRAGWAQPSGDLHFAASAADVGFAALRLPN